LLRRRSVTGDVSLRERFVKETLCVCAKFHTLCVQVCSLCGAESSDAAPGKKISAPTPTYDFDCYPLAYTGTIYSNANF
jgi:hypothetical protein